jgi:thymidylate synthase (FAD)
MKLCKPLFEIWEQSAGLEGVYKQIERVGRVCYKSEDKITEDSAKPFQHRRYYVINLFNCFHILY